MIYFVSDGEAIKIGRSGNVDVRLKALAVASANPLTLLATVEGDCAHESRVHADLADYRMNGEWFVDCASVRCAIDAYVANGINPIPTKTIRPTPTSEVVKRCRVAGWRLVSAYERSGFPKMEAYELVAAEIGINSGWLRKFLSGHTTAKEPRLSVGYSLLLQAGMINEPYIAAESDTESPAVVERSR